VDQGGLCIRRIGIANAYVTTIAGSNESGFVDSSSPGTSAKFGNVLSLSVFPSADMLYVADYANNAFRSVFLDGRVMTIFSMLGHYIPSIAFNSQGLLVAVLPLLNQVVQFNLQGQMTVLSGSCQAGGLDSSNLFAASFNSPSFLSLDAYGNTIVTEPGAGRIRLIALSWNLGVSLTFPAAFNACPAGYFCPNESATPSLCPKLNCCPTQGMAASMSCPVGRICPSFGMIEPLLCPAGQYCSLNGLSTPNGNCSAGFFCVPGSGNQFGGTHE
jgi:hypothetical protein